MSTMIYFKGASKPKSVTLSAMFFYLRYLVSYRETEERNYRSRLDWLCYAD